MYEITNVNKNEFTGDFIELCREHYRDASIVYGVIIILGCIFTALYISFLDNPITISWSGVYVLCMLFVFKCVVLAYQMTCGILKCKTIIDYLDFAEVHTLIPNTIILTKRLEAESLEIVNVNPESNKIMCRNTETGEFKALILDEKKTFKELFRFYQTLALAENEMAIDLQGDELSAYVRNWNPMK